jgi:hypothetical protein
MAQKTIFVPGISRMRIGQAGGGFGHRSFPLKSEEISLWGVTVTLTVESTDQGVTVTLKGDAELEVDTNPVSDSTLPWNWYGLNWTCVRIGIRV